MNASSYVKIAVFVLALGGAGIGYMALTSSGMSPLNTRTFEAVFADVMGISTRSLVYLAGVPVGQVQSIELYGSQARVRFAILNDVELRQDAFISRQPSSLLGTSVLNLHPGTDLTPIAAPGTLIRAAPRGGDMAATMEVVQDLGHSIGQILDEFRTNQMALLAISLETFNSIAQTIDDQTGEQFDRISRILESTALIVERTDRIMEASEASISGSFEDMREAISNIRIITGEVAAGRGNVGQALFDDRLYQSLLATAERTEGVIIRLEETLENISTLARTADGVVSSAGEIVEQALGLGVMVDTNVTYGFLNERTRAAASLRLEPRSGDRWYRVGVTYAPGGVTGGRTRETFDRYGNLERRTQTTSTLAIDAELARRVGAVTLRGGMLESTAGFGVDLQLFNWMSLSGEMFRFNSGNNPNLRSAVTIYPFFDPDSNLPWNWLYLRAGVTDTLNDDRDFFIGGGLRFFDREVRGLVGMATVFN